MMNYSYHKPHSCNMCSKRTRLVRVVVKFSDTCSIYANASYIHCLGGCGYINLWFRAIYSIIHSYNNTGMCPDSQLSPEYQLLWAEATVKPFWRSRHPKTIGYIIDLWAAVMNSSLSRIGLPNVSANYSCSFVAYCPWHNVKVVYWVKIPLHGWHEC